MTLPVLMRVVPRVQHYAWGDTRFIPELLGRSHREATPHAELWMGAHPLLPSSVVVGGVERDLPGVLDASGREVLGAGVASLYGTLPYLIKIIAAARPLSIQAHPDARQAAEGFAREDAAGVPLDDPARNYKDPRHKPELVVALTEFFVLCGFRPFDEITEVLAAYPELGACAEGYSPTRAGLEALLGRLLRLPRARVNALLAPLVARLHRENARTTLPRDDVRYWMLQSDALFGGVGDHDRGLAVMPLLNLVRLEPGQGLYLPSGVLHAYLQGAAVEVMAASDNVLRGGLTMKPVDIEGLLSVVRLEGERPPVIEPSATGEAGACVYTVPVAEFELSRIAIAPGACHGHVGGHSAEMLIVTSLDAGAAVKVAANNGPALTLAKGGVCLAAANTAYTITATGRAELFRAGTPALGGEASASSAAEDVFVADVTRSIALTERLCAEGRAPEIIGTVSGSEEARAFWQVKLDEAREALGAREAISFHEDLPTNQAFGLLLLWQRLRERIRTGWGALVAFVFGEGTRATPFTETESAQKPAMVTFVTRAAGGAVRYVPMAELALRHFIPVQQYLRRSGFEGLVVKWGDEVQIPTRDLAGADPLFADADVVRFVSMAAMTDVGARHKDWIGVDAAGFVTAFIPRRPLAEMAALADRGLLRREGSTLVGGINLGSIAVSFRLLDVLLAQFAAEVNDSAAGRAARPDLDPQFFTALTVAVLDDVRERERAWETALAESAAMRAMARAMPDVLARLRRAVEAYRRAHGRNPKMVVLDFGGQYWGDMGRHAEIYNFYMDLNDPGARGRIARALAGIAGERDRHGNTMAGTCHVAPGVAVRDSVLMNVRLEGSGLVERSVLIGTRATGLRVIEGFDVLSAVRDLAIAPRGGAYRVVSAEPVRAGPGERVTTLFLPGGREVLMRVHEDTDLGDRAAAYDVAIAGNPLSFREAHALMGRVSPRELAARRELKTREVFSV